MTLQDAIQYAVTTNPEIGQAGANREAIGFELRQARGLYLPQVDLEASIGPGWRDGPGDSEYDEDWMLRREVSIIGRQMLFDGYAADSEVERQASRADAAAYRVLERAEFVGLDIVQAYLDMLRQQDLLELARDNLAVQRGILGDVRQRVDAGRSSVADSQQANERVRSAQATLVDIERGLEDARLAFERLVGLPPFELSPPQPVAASVPADRAMAVTVALDDNPTLLAAEADIDTAYAEYRAAKANNYPTINLEGRARTGDDLDGVDGRETDVSALVVLRYNLYRGGIDQANIQEQIRRIDEARRRVLQVEREIEEQVGRSYVALDAASRRTEVLAEQIAFGEQVRTSYRQQFDIGQRTLLDVLDAENSLFNTRVAMVTAEYAERFAAYRVLASLGRLLPTLGVAPPETAVAEARAGADVPPTPVSEELPRRSLTR
ncbi:MAG TPA: TolC family outer membrane protein [Alphaproteobacteria bacterium]|nr:TolC family outer membrane protein [Alphaproteobacteria bacterium]